MSIQQRNRGAEEAEDFVSGFEGYINHQVVHFLGDIPLAKLTGREIQQIYTDIQELNARILNELIEKIVVHEKVIGADGIKTQQIDIYYKFIGYIKWDMAEPGTLTLLPMPSKPKSPK